MHKDELHVLLKILRGASRAGRRAAKLEEPGARLPKPIVEAIKAFHDSAPGLAIATKKKYKRVLRYLENVTTARGIRSVDEVRVEDLDAYRAYRGEIAGLTWLKEFQILRQFFQFCTVRKWADDNPAHGVDKPKNIKPTEVVPYKREDVVKILAACDVIGRYPYERLRARALVLLLRYTALRIADVALLGRDRVRDGEVHVRTRKEPAKLSGCLCIPSYRPHWTRYPRRVVARRVSTFSGAATARLNRWCGRRSGP